MGPLEVIFTIIVIIFALIGLARGYKRELGSTLIILVAIFVLSFFEEEITRLFGTVSAQLFASNNPSEARNLVYLSFFQIIFAVIVFAGYAGRTLEFPGTPAPPPLGSLLDLAVGTLNGYLIAGTLWYYLDRFGYPTQAFGWIQLPLTSTGQALVEFLPQRIFESPTYWMIPVAALLILRVRG
jgi:uncharacterized membrane protein required for colicin V production